MTDYTFNYKVFYFHIHAENEAEAVAKAVRALNESSVTASSQIYIPVELTAGAFEGRIYLDPLEITSANIYNREEVPELDESVPF